MAERRCNATLARKVLGWPKRCKLAHAFRWKYCYKGLKLAKLLDQLGAFLTSFRAEVLGWPKRYKLALHSCRNTGAKG